MPRRARALYVGLAPCLAAFVACGFPRPPDVPDCTTASDCTSPGAPFCQPSSGTCVGCLDGTSCPTDKPVCDGQEHVCRGCASDDDCASGVCIEADGTCASDAAIVAVSSVGVDVGECPKAAPCASLSYALSKVSAARNVVRVVGGDLPTATSTIDISKDVVIDSNGTRFFAPANAPMFTVAGGSVVTIEGIVLTGVQAQPTITVGASASLRLQSSTVDHGLIRVTNGAVAAHGLHAASSTLDCMSGTMTVTASLFESSAISFSGCQTTVTRNRWDPGFDRSVGGSAGLLSVENNVFVVPSEFVDLIQVSGLAPGSIFAFNTIVNTSAVGQSPVAVTCDATLDLTSNLIAYNSPNPIAGDGCVARSSLFDLAGAPDAPDNASGDATTFFKNRAGGDFHLAAGSPARGLGQPDLVTTDFDDNPRPAPSGTRPDVGAYEAP